MSRTISLIRFMVIACFLLTTSATVLLAQEPKPEFYGIYALENGKLTQLLTDTDRNDFGPNVRFVLFDKGLALRPPMNKMFFIPPEQPTAQAQPKNFDWNDFLKQSQQFGVDSEKYLDYGVPPNAAEIQFQTGPYASEDEMMKVVPRGPLPPGQYQLMKGVRFWVQRSEVIAAYTAPRSAPPPPSPPKATNTTTANTTAPRKIVLTDFAVSNDTFRPIQVYLDNSSTPITVKPGNMKIAQLEVGTNHRISAVVNGKTFQMDFTVPRVMNALGISDRGFQTR